MTIAKSHNHPNRARDQFTAALDAIFSDTGRMDIGISLPSGAWLRPDAAVPGNAHRRLGALDRAGVLALAPELWARNLSGGCGIHWRGQIPAPLVFLDDLDDRDAAALAARYRAMVIETSPGSHQALILCDRPLDRLQQHQVQSELVRRLNACGRRRADPGATGGGQFARMPGFGHPGHGARLVRVVGRPWSGARVLEVAAIRAVADGASGALCAPQRATGSDAGLACAPKPQRPPEAAPGLSPCSAPRGPRATRSGACGQGREDGKTRKTRGSESEIDFSIACHAIRNARSPESIISEIADRAFSRGKRSTDSECRAYAERTYTAALRAVRGQSEPAP